MNDFDRIASSKYSEPAIRLWNHYDKEAITMERASVELGIVDPSIINEAKKIHRHWKNWVVETYGVCWGWTSNKSPSIEEKPLSQYGKKEKKKPVRVKVFGYSVTSVLRWMGANGWEDRFEDAALAVCPLGDNYQISDWTIKLQLKAGAKMADPKDWNTLNKKAKLAPITPDQAQQLEEATM